MGLYNGLNNGLSYNGINNGLQPNYYSGLVNGLMPNETTEDGRAFITVWNTRNTSTGSSNARQIRLPLVATGSYNFVVEWGDGSKDIIRAYNAAAVTHTYASAGIYTVKIKGVCTSLTFNPGTTDTNKLLEIVQWGNFRLSDSYGFNSCINLRLNNTRDIVDYTNSSSLVGLFQFCTMPYIRGIGDINLSLFNGTALSFMFQQNVNFNDPSIIKWDTLKVNSLAGTFLGCTSFNQDISYWNTSGVTNMQSTFNNCTNFNQPIGSWNVSNVVDMIGMFRNATSFNQPLSGWNVSRVISMNNMFQDMTSFNQDINSWNVSGVTTMGAMFQSSVAFNQPIGDWDVRKVTNMGSMFQSATNFNQPLSGWNVSGVTTMPLMFLGALNFNQPIGNWDVRKVTTMNGMFSNAPAFNQNIGDWRPILCTDFNSFMNGKTPATFSSENLDAIYSGWTRYSLQLERTITFGTAKHTTGTTVYRNLLTTPAGYGRTISVTNVTNNGSGLIRISTGNFTSPPPTNSVVQISGVLGVTDANANWNVTLISSAPVIFDLNDSTFSGTYAGGGTVGFLSSGFAGNAINNGSGLIRLSIQCMIPSTGTTAAQISGVIGTFEANGTWLLSYVSPGVVDLIGSTFINPWIPSGGQIRVGLGWTIIDGGT